MTAMGPAMVLHGPTLAARFVTERGPVAVGGRVAATAYPSTPTVEAGGLSLRFVGGRADTGLALAVDFAHGWSLDTAATLGLLALQGKTTAISAAATAFAPQVRLEPVGTLQMGPAVRLGTGTHALSVRLLATVDVAFRSYRYRIGDTGQVLFDPWLARPGLSVSLAWVRRLTFAR